MTQQVMTAAHIPMTAACVRNVSFYFHEHKGYKTLESPEQY
jgi:uncharacterized membrane protein